ncbi:hypothetical protein PV326_009095 [Microctonus aethiopoides]|nr:hypothetical protein PV326_009095 [Microctonus aethiopoides]
MVSIIKNQLLKHLSRFTKNLSTDQINLSTLRGEGELSNLELDEAVLTDLLELPSWLRLKSAWCNKVILRIQWTKLKSVPIYLHLDEVHIEIVTCEDLRSPMSPSNASAFPGGTNKYSFIHKVIDGITVAVNTVSVTLKSPAFVASVQMSRIMVESKSPTWQRGDLRMTRLKDVDRGQLLIFKELEWQTLRIEARSTKDEDLTPLRLLTNQARCRITIKKRISDCFVMGSRLVLILDDLLWVLTDSQLKAALHFIDSLGSLIERATMSERKMKAARKLEVLPEYQAQISQQARSKAPCTTAISKVFMRYDVIETSYHFLSQRIDLHLCDDPGNGRSSHPDLKDGGALQISLVKFQIDYYPYHLAMADRKHWAKYRENSTPHVQWLQQSLNSFRGQFMEFIDLIHSQLSMKKYSNEAGTETLQKSDDEMRKNEQQSPLLESDEKKPGYNIGSGTSMRNFILEQLSTLMTTCIVIRIHDFTIYKVTTLSKKPTTKEFIAGDRDKFSLPEDITILHAEFTYYYYPGDLTFPLPPPKFYVQSNPLQINYDMHSCLWLNSFVLNLYQSLIGHNKNEISDEVSAPTMYFDVKIEAILPRVVIEAQFDYPNQRDRPKSLHIQTSRVSVTNVRTSERSSRADLAECLNAFQMGQMFYSTGFPSKNTDFQVVIEKFLRHCAGTDNIKDYPTEINGDIMSKLTKNLLWIEAKDVWCCSFEPVWADFFGARAVGSNRPVPFIDAFPVTVWLYINDNQVVNQTNDRKEYLNNANVHGLAYISNLISVQINHYQYLFLLRQMEIMSEMSKYLTVDSCRILNIDDNNASSMVIGVLIPQLELTLIMPSLTPGKENSGGDLESVVPDSSSIAEDILPTLSSMPNQNIAAAAARLEFSSRRSNTSNDIVESQLDAPHSVVTFKNNDAKFDVKDIINQPIISQRNNSDDLEMKKNVKYSNTSVSNVTSPPTPFIPNNFNVGLSNMRKGFFANLMTSLDSALKASPEDGSSDTVSMRSDISSDSDNYVAISFEEQDKNDSFFGSLNVTGITAVEEASEVIEETPDTQSEKSLDSACKRKDLVSMITFKLSKVEVIQQSVGFSSVIKAQIARVVSEECSSIPWDEFQTKFSSRSRGWIELTSDDCKTNIKVRLEHNLKDNESSECNKNCVKNFSNLNFSNKIGLLGSFEDYIKAEVNDFSIILSMSVVMGMMDLIEDEIIALPLPMDIFIKNLTIKLNEDRPPNNITSPGPVPIDLTIVQLQIKRDKRGIFYFQPIINENDITNTKINATLMRNSHIEKQLYELNNMNKQLEIDNEELKRRVVALDNLSDENSRLRRSYEELELIKSRLNDAQDYIKELLKEKSVLQETVGVLQKQLPKSSGDSSGSNRTSSWSIKR